MNKQDKHVEVPSSKDRLLWKAFKGGDQKAYACMYQQNVRLLFKYGSKLTKDRELVKDCIQELFLYLWDHRERLGDTNHIRFYLFKSLRRSIINKLVKAGGTLFEDEISPDYNFLTITSHETDLILAESAEEYHQRLPLALDQLPDRQKEAVYLKYYHYLSFEEIASVMNVSRRSVYKLLHKAIRALQKNMQSILISVSFLIFFSFLFLN